MTNDVEKPRFVGGKPRSEVVPLAFPIEYRGKVYDSIEVHRLTVADIEAHSARYSDLAKTDKEAAEKLRLPTFGDVPDEVIDFLDIDDRAAVNAAVERTALPKSLRAEIPSSSETGDSSRSA